MFLYSFCFLFFMTLDALLQNPEQIFPGNTYDLGVDYADPYEPLIMVYRRDGQELMMLFNQPPGLCWAFPRSLDSFLHDPVLIDLLAEDIVDYLNNELILSIEEGPPDFDTLDFEPTSQSPYQQLPLFPPLLLSERKPTEDELAYSLDHQMNTYKPTQYCFPD